MNVCLHMIDHSAGTIRHPVARSRRSEGRHPAGTAPVAGVRRRVAEAAVEVLNVDVLEGCTHTQKASRHKEFNSVVNTRYVNASKQKPNNQLVFTMLCTFQKLRPTPRVYNLGLLLV